jgi:DNA-binding response OmpR family regulator
VKEKTAPKSQKATPPAGRVLVLEPSEQLATEILEALHDAAPGAQVELTRSLEEAQRSVLDARPDLFVLDVDATYDLGQEFLYDLRTSHPKAKAIIITAIHLQAHREEAKGLGAIHFLEKPFPGSDFADLVQALLDPSSQEDGEKFQGTLSDLHFADIIQLKCMSGSTSVLEFTGPRGEKARVFFENGQVRHAVAPGLKGMDAFNEILSWKGGMIGEVKGAGSSPRTIDLDWQILLMEGVRQVDETRGSKEQEKTSTGGGRKILVIDDSLMLLSFVSEILSELGYQVTTAATAEEGLQAAADVPDLILLDYVLPDMKGDEVSRRLSADPKTEKVPVLYMSGLGTDLKASKGANPNVIGFLNKPFTSETLLKTIETYIPKSSDAAEPKAQKVESAPEENAAPAELAQEVEEFAAVIEESAEEVPEFAAVIKEPAEEEEAEEQEITPRWNASAADIVQEHVASETPVENIHAFTPAESSSSHINGMETHENAQPPDGGAFFSGDTNFFSLHWALQTIAKEKLTGSLRCFWEKAPVQLLADRGRIVLATTRDEQLYCSEAPITLVNVDSQRIAQARQIQKENGAPLFMTLAEENLILHEPAQQLVQHYGQKLFAQLWTAKRVRFVFEQTDELPDYTTDIPAEEDVDQWSLNTLRFIQYQELEDSASYDQESIPAYTRDGFDRVQNLRLTVAEAQFASQFNGTRSIAQIAKNLRLDLKFARLTLFRFKALEIIELWPAAVSDKPEKRGLLGRFGFGG